MTYELRLSNFEGPLDLLLHLIGKAKIQPQDIFVSEITEQYLAYMEEEELTDLDAASEFLQMAATLLYIKSRSLLPNLSEEDEEDALLLENSLVERLNEYKRCKELSESLRLLEKDSEGQYYKLPEELFAEERRPRFLNADLQMLLAAYLRMLRSREKAGAEPPPIILHADALNLQTQVRVILGRLAIKPRMDFAALFSKDPSREEIAVTFYALLELLAQEKVGVRQERAFGNIEVFRRKESVHG